ncbi:MAG: hypothetical protein LAO04_20845 [Acidobacteriia bacterium]|nr:hypothetical protein [Terriglobia bacterium]
MTEDENTSIKARIDRIRQLSDKGRGGGENFEAATLAQSVIYDTVGGSHPIMAALGDALESADWIRASAASRAVVSLYAEGALKSPRLAIAREIEGNILDIAQAQAEAAETNNDAVHKQVHLGIAAFLAGASLEDALRRLCDARGLAYDAQRTSISKLQAALFQPSKQIEVISLSENKHITAWGDTRNKADHGRFDEITHTEVVSMVLGVRTLVEKHLS